MSRLERPGVNRTAQRAVSAVGRVVRHPSIVSEVGRKIGGRLTATRHRSRVDSYARFGIPLDAALADLFGTSVDRVNALVREPSFGRLLKELEAYHVPPRARVMKGASYLEACYSLARLLQPNIAVEAGVALGYSTAAILQGLEDNRVGRLDSIDLPVFSPGVERFTGHAIPERLRSASRWTLELGPQRRVLPRLLAREGSIDFFLYDSDKSYEGMMHCWRLVWPHLSPGAVLMADGVSHNDAILDFADSVNLRPVIIPKPAHKSVYPDQVFYLGLLRKNA